MEKDLSHEMILSGDIIHTLNLSGSKTTLYDLHRLAYICFMQKFVLFVFSISVMPVFMSSFVFTISINFGHSYI